MIGFPFRRLIEALAAGAWLDPLRKRARETVLEGYALNPCLPQQLALINEVAGG